MYFFHFHCPTTPPERDPPRPAQPKPWTRRLRHRRRPRSSKHVYYISALSSISCESFSFLLSSVFLHRLLLSFLSHRLLIIKGDWTWGGGLENAWAGPLGLLCVFTYIYIYIKRKRSATAGPLLTGPPGKLPVLPLASRPW